jgi:hypothetical protein
MEMFGVINSEEKAYALGWIAANCVFSDAGELRVVSDAGSLYVPIANMLDKCWQDPDKPFYMFHSPQTQENVRAHLFTGFPELDDDLSWVFVRGFVEGGDSCILPECVCKVSAQSSKMLKGVADFTLIPHTISDRCMQLTGTNCIDFLRRVYPNSLKIRSSTLHEAFLRLLMPPVDGSGLPKCRICVEDGSFSF